ncbi:hypothetical protein [Nonomuraea zeae]|uniref:hypothetical protein n=1 Tax=Nonomuraea zeae TaxID=1642303 RepID=UPI00360DF312
MSYQSDQDIDVASMEEDYDPYAYEYDDLWEDGECWCGGDCALDDDDPEDGEELVIIFLEDLNDDDQ